MAHSDPMKWWPILAVAVVLAGCGGNEVATPSDTAASSDQTASTTGAAAETTVFFYRDGALVPVTLTAPETQAVARAALDRLVTGPPGGYETAIPAGVRVEDVT